VSSKQLDNPGARRVTSNPILSRDREGALLALQPFGYKEGHGFALLIDYVLESASDVLVLP
jgi:hypothetical protein